MVRLTLGSTEFSDGVDEPVVEIRRPPEPGLGVSHHSTHSSPSRRLVRRSVAPLHPRTLELWVTVVKLAPFLFLRALLPFAAFGLRSHSILSAFHEFPKAKGVSDSDSHSFFLKPNLKINSFSKRKTHPSISISIRLSRKLRSK